MKKVLLGILLVTMLSACREEDKYERTARVTHPSILGKEMHGVLAAHSNVFVYRICIFDGDDAEWYTVDEKTFNTIEKGDTLRTLVLIKTKSP